MKKLLAILGAVGLTATGASSVVACDKSDKDSTEISQLTFVDGKSVKDLEALMIKDKIADGKVVADSVATPDMTGDPSWFNLDQAGQQESEPILALFQETKDFKNSMDQDGNILAYTFTVEAKQGATEITLILNKMEGKVEMPQEGEQVKVPPLTVMAKQVIQLTQPDGGDKEKTPNLDALKAKIAEAKEIEQGKKTADAFQKLQDAITTAEKVTDETAASDALTALNKAIDDFNNSADETTPDSK
ncbi:lipoprotein [Spiroplasma sp. DGKH1]|uniref:lipoprotein n=1 Tax=Spiroplasma sp. DGKH1 TaxID=3050074 RepID=UPI0034C6312B